MEGRTPPRTRCRAANDPKVSYIWNFTSRASSVAREEGAASCRRERLVVWTTGSKKYRSRLRPLDEEALAARHEHTV
eukprot:15475708-Alexandrium_andersonii.AAC.1